MVFHTCTARAEELTGTWRGTVTSDGQSAEFTATLSEEGYPLFEYTNNKGQVETVELNGRGQIRFVPPGGGVTTVAVESVVKRPDGVSYVLDVGFERASGGYMDQRYVSEQHDYALTNEGLSVRVVSQAATYFGDRGGSTGGPQKAEIVEGVLKKME